MVIIDTVLVLLLAVLVAGLLRSHADILRALHALGAGVGDPAPGGSDGPPGPDRAGATAEGGSGVPVRMGPTLPGRRQSSAVHDLLGSSPEGDAVAVAVSGVDHFTLMVFVSSGCSTCQSVWASLAHPDELDLPAEVRTVVVTRGTEQEIPAEVRRRAPLSLTVVMSSQAWDDYDVPGSPFFVLVDGRGGRRVGEGVAQHMTQARDLVRRALADAGFPSTAARRDRPVTSFGGPEREALTDRELQAAGIQPGDPSLYPRHVDDVFSPISPGAHVSPGAPVSPGARGSRGSLGAPGPPRDDQPARRAPGAAPET